MTLRETTVLGQVRLVPDCLLTEPEMFVEGLEVGVHLKNSGNKIHREKK